MAVAAHVVFTGTDYWSPRQLFRARAGHQRAGPGFRAAASGRAVGGRALAGGPADGTELPEMSGPLPRGTIDRPGTQAFLDARGAESALPELLTAVGRAMNGGRPVLVVSHDVTENAWWIAAIFTSSVSTWRTR